MVVAMSWQEAGDGEFSGYRIFFFYFQTRVLEGSFNAFEKMVKMVNFALCMFYHNF